MSKAKERAREKKVGKIGVRQDEEPAEEEGPAPQDIIKPVTDLVEAAYEIIDTNFDEISEQLNKFKKETFRMDKELGIKKKKAVKIGSFKTKRMLNKNKNKLNKTKEIIDKKSAVELKLKKALEIKHKL